MTDKKEKEDLSATYELLDDEALRKRQARKSKNALPDGTSADIMRKEMGTAVARVAAFNDRLPATVPRNTAPPSSRDTWLRMQTKLLTKYTALMGELDGEGFEGLKKKFPHILDIRTMEAFTRPYYCPETLRITVTLLLLCTCNEKIFTQAYGYFIGHEPNFVMQLAGWLRERKLVLKNGKQVAIIDDEKALEKCLAETLPRIAYREMTSTNWQGSAVQTHFLFHLFRGLIYT